MGEERKSEEEGEWKRVEMSEQVAMVFGWTEEMVGVLQCVMELKYFKINYEI